MVISARTAIGVKKNRPRPKPRSFEPICYDFDFYAKQKVCDYFKALFWDWLRAQMDLTKDTKTASTF